MKKMNKKGMGILGFIILFLIIVIIWGLFGGFIAQDVGITCDMGAGDLLCWQWHKNLIGQAEEIIKNIFS